MAVMVGWCLMALSAQKGYIMPYESSVKDSCDVKKKG